MTPNKIPGMVLKGIDRRRDKSQFLNRKNQKYLEETARKIRQAREEEQHKKNKIRGF
jgi:hypothetical protein